MAIVTLEEMLRQLGITAETGSDLWPLISQKIDAAQSHVERMLGFTFASTYGGDGQDPVPEPLKEAVMQLAAWWFEQREAGIVGQGASVVPFGVAEIVDGYRNWTF